mgnify:CR=1 FL=1
MVDFSALLSKPADEIKRPPALPAGTYKGIIKTHKFDESSEKKTPYVRFDVKFTGEFLEDVDANDVEGIDIAKRTLSKDYYLTEDAIYRLKEMLESLGIPSAGRSIGEMIPEAIEAEVLMEISAKPDRREPDTIRNNIEKMFGQRD